MFKYGFRSIETAGFGWVGTLDALALAGSHVALRKKQSAHQLGEREGEGASMTLADALFICRPVTSFPNTTTDLRPGSGGPAATAW